MTIKKTVFQNIAELILLTFVLKGIGFINQAVIAYFFGTSQLTDVYYISSGFIGSISSIILSTVTVGIVNIYIESKGNSKSGVSDKFVSDALIVITVIMALLFVVTNVFAYFIAGVITPNYNTGDKEVLTKLLRIMAFIFPFQGFVTIFTSVLQAENKFIPIKLIGTISSGISIISVVFLSKRYGMYSLVFSYMVSYVINALFLRFSLKDEFKFKIYGNPFRNDKIKKLLILSLPLILGTAAHEINLIVDKSISSGIGEGAVTALSYSSVLYLFVENVIISSIVMAYFPDIAAKRIHGEIEKIKDMTSNIVVFSEFLLIPISLCVFCSSTQIIQVVFMRGNFDEYSLKLTSFALKGYVVGLPFLALRDISTRIFYSFNNTKMPAIINVVSVIINILLDFLLGKMFGIIGITLATSISCIFSSLMLCILIKQCDGKIMESFFNMDFVKLIMTVIPVIIYSFAISYYMEGVLEIGLCLIGNFFIEYICLSVLKVKVIGKINEQIKRIAERR